MAHNDHPDVLEIVYKMHGSSYENMRKALDRYIGRDFFAGQRKRVIDVGSTAIYGSYRPLFASLDVEYIGLDLAEGEGVDVVLDEPYSYPMKSDSVDLVISGQMLEHCEFFWQAFQEMARVVSPDGYIILIAPSSGPVHRYPVDCYRFYPDSFRALAKLTQIHIVALWRDERGPWKDLVGIFAKNERNRNKLPILSTEGIPTSPEPLMGVGAPFSKHKYQYDIDPCSDSAGAKIVRLIGVDKRVLELGPGPGSISKILKKNGCKITALEIDESAIEIAQPYCERIYHANLNDESWPDLLADEERFDTVVAADVLEHLYDPAATLRRMTQCMTEDGFIVISLPHIGHSAIHACLLDEDFEYREVGLLDYTHVRFFGIKNMQSLIEQANLKIVQAEFVVRHPEQTEFAGHWKKTPRALRSALAENRYGLVFQVILKATFNTGDGEAISLMSLPVIMDDLQTYGKTYTQENKSQHLAMLESADRLAVAGQSNEALFLYKSALLSSHNPAFLWLRIINLLSAIGQKEALLQACVDATPINQNNADLLIASAQIKYKSGYPVEALQEIELATQLASDMPIPWTLRGDWLCASKKWNEAIPCYRKAIELQSSNVWALKGLAAALLRDGKRSEGELVFAQALAFSKVHFRPIILHQWAQTLLALGEPMHALTHQQLAASTSSNPEIHLSLAQLLSRLGRNSDAVDALKSSLSKGVRSPQLSALLRSLSASQ